MSALAPGAASPRSAELDGGEAGESLADLAKQSRKVLGERRTMIDPEPAIDFVAHLNFLSRGLTAAAACPVKCDARRIFANQMIDRYYKQGL
jgi:hypothetical protein